MLLDVSKYESYRASRWARLNAAYELREGDRVPVGFSIGISYYCWLFGYPIHEAYENPELQVEIMLKGIEWEYEFLRADSSTATSLGYGAGPVQEAIIFGAPVEKPRDTSPRIVHLFETLDEAANAKVPDPATNPRLRDYLRLYERFNATARRMGVRMPLNEKPRLGIHPPISALCALIDPVKAYVAMYTEPEALRRALDRMFEAFCTYFEYFRKLYGEPMTGMHFGLADDNIAAISGEMFREWEMPYYLKFRERYRPKGFSLHTDGPNDQHFRILADEAGITSMDIGGFSSLERAVAEMKGKVFISGGLNCKDLYAEGRLSDAARVKALRAMKLAAPGGGFQLAIGGETYVGVDPQGLRELVKLVEERGKFPIDIMEGEIA